MKQPDASAQYPDTTELGDTGEFMATLGLGTAAGSSPRLIREALARGVQLVDTAESYGSEEAVGEAVAPLRGRAIVATKVSPENLAYGNVLRSADRSLQRLRLDHIDLYQVHWPNSQIPIDETMAALAALVDAGKIRHIGVSNFTVGDLRRAQAALGARRIVSNQVNLSLNMRTACGELAEYCRAQRITLIAYSPLAGSPLKIVARDRSGQLARFAEQYGKTAQQIMLNWVIGNARTMAIFRSSSDEHLASNLGAMGWRLSNADRQLLERAIPFRRRSRVELAARSVAWKMVRRLRALRSRASGVTP